MLIYLSWYVGCYFQIGMKFAENYIQPRRPLLSSMAIHAYYSTMHYNNLIRSIDQTFTMGNWLKMD